MKNIAIIGGGGHAKILIDLINEIGNYKIIGIFDDYKTEKVLNYLIIGRICDIKKVKEVDCYVIGIGNDNFRKKIYDDYPDLNWETLIHPKSFVSKMSTIGSGTVVCAGAIIQPDVHIGKQCIINTNSSVDHECLIGNFCSISPGSVICGQVKIGENCFIGANSTIIQCLNIGNNCIIGAGSVIIKNIGNNKKVVGNPSREIL